MRRDAVSMHSSFLFSFLQVLRVRSRLVWPIGLLRIYGRASRVERQLGREERSWMEKCEYAVRLLYITVRLELEFEMRRLKIWGT